MARPGISFDDVANAAAAISASGKTPTIAAVREALGGTGSPNTVHKHLTQWKAQQQTTEPAAPAATLPARLLDAINAEIEHARSEAEAGLQEQLTQAQAETRELARAGEAIETERDELAEQAATLTSQRDAAAATATERLEEIERLTRQIEQQARQIHTEQQAAEAARMTLAKAELKIEAQAEKLTEQGKEILSLRNELSATVKERGEAYQASAVMKAQLEAAERRATEADRRENSTSAKLEKIEEQQRKNAQELSDTRLHIQAQQTALDTANREIERLKAAAAKQAQTKPAQPSKPA